MLVCVPLPWLLLPLPQAGDPCSSSSSSGSELLTPLLHMGAPQPLHGAPPLVGQRLGSPSRAEAPAAKAALHAKPGSRKRGRSSLLRSHTATSFGKPYNPPSVAAAAVAAAAVAAAAACGMGGVEADAAASAADEPLQHPLTAGSSVEPSVATLAAVESAAAAAAEAAAAAGMVTAASDQQKSAAARGGGERAAARRSAAEAGAEAAAATAPAAAKVAQAGEAAAAAAAAAAESPPRRDLEDCLECRQQLLAVLSTLLRALSPTRRPSAASSAAAAAAAAAAVAADAAASAAGQAAAEARKSATVAAAAAAAGSEESSKRTAAAAGESAASAAAAAAEAAAVAAAAAAADELEHEGGDLALYAGDLQFLWESAADPTLACILLNHNAAELLLLLLLQWMLPALDYLASSAAVREKSQGSTAFVASRRLQRVARYTQTTPAAVVELLLGAAANLLSHEDLEGPAAAAATAAATAALPLAADVFCSAVMVCQDAGALKEALRGVAAALGIRQKQQQQPSEAVRFRRLQLFRAAPTPEAAAELLKKTIYILRQSLHAPLLQAAAHCIALLLAIEGLDASESAAAADEAAQAGLSESHEVDVLGAPPPLLLLLRQQQQQQLLLLVSIERAAELLRLPGLPTTEVRGPPELSEPPETRAASFMQLLQQQQQHVLQKHLDEEDSKALACLLLLCSDLLRADTLLLLREPPDGPPDALGACEMLLQICCCTCCCSDTDEALEAALLLHFLLLKNNEETGLDPAEVGGISTQLAKHTHCSSSRCAVTNGPNVFCSGGYKNSSRGSSSSSSSSRRRARDTSGGSNNNLASSGSGNSSSSTSSIEREGRKREATDATFTSPSGNSSSSSSSSSGGSEAQELARSIREASVAYFRCLLESPEGAEIIARAMLLLQQESDRVSEEERGAAVLLLLQHAQQEQLEMYKPEISQLMGELEFEQD
ncbi:hypothetical protein Esti_006455 [Eimeria stiedai]